MDIYVKSRLLQIVIGAGILICLGLFAHDPSNPIPAVVATAGILWQIHATRVRIERADDGSWHAITRIAPFGRPLLALHDPLPVDAVFLVVTGHPGALRFQVLVGEAREDRPIRYTPVGLHDTAGWPGFLMADSQARRLAAALQVPAILRWDTAGAPEKILVRRLKSGKRAKPVNPPVTETRTGTDTATPFRDLRKVRVKAAACAWLAVYLLVPAGFLLLTLGARVIP